MNNLSKRIVTSFFLLLIFFICFFYNKYLWLALLIITSIVSFFEFNNLIKKIWITDKGKIFFINLTSIFFLIFFIYSAYKIGLNKQAFIFILFICIFSDIGGYIIGKIVGGKKLSKISPNKTISGSIGSFIFSLFPLASFYFFYDKNLLILKLFFLTLILSFICQIGDLFISFFKRKAKVKDTGKILPGHGGLLDRIDGIIFTIPVAFLIDIIFY